MTHQGKTETPPQQLKQQWQTLLELAEVLGFEPQTEEIVKEKTGGLSDGEIEALIEQRAEARKAKNFAESDRIRDELQVQGIVVIDQPGGVTRWHRK